MPKYKQEADKLTSWLKSHGQSFEQAEEDTKRWKSWATKPSREYRQLMDAEIAERKARETAEKAKQGEAVNGKPK